MAIPIQPNQHFCLRINAGSYVASGGLNRLRAMKVKKSMHKDGIQMETIPIRLLVLAAQNIGCSESLSVGSAATCGLATPVWLVLARPSH